MNGFNFVRLDGSMNLKQRHAAIAQLSNTCLGSPSIMLLSLTAGGVGVNLTAASRVFLMDPVRFLLVVYFLFDKSLLLGI